MVEHALSTKFRGPAVITQRNAFRPVAVEAEHDGVALLHMSGHFVLDCSEVVWGERPESRFKHPWLSNLRSRAFWQTVRVVELVRVGGMLGSNLNDGGHGPTVLGAERH